LIGLLAPELVLFTAWYQNIRAREMEKVVTKHLRKVRRERKALTVAQPPSDNIQTSQQQNEPARVENHDETTSRIKVEKDGTNEDGPDVEQGLGGEDEADKLKVFIF
jgi:(2Fe-2S) ferredoxin